MAARLSIRRLGQRPPRCGAHSEREVGFTGRHRKEEVAVHRNGEEATAHDRARTTLGKKTYARSFHTCPTTQ